MSKSNSEQTVLDFISELVNDGVPEHIAQMFANGLDDATIGALEEGRRKMHVISPPHPVAEKRRDPDGQWRFWLPGYAPKNH
jgi:hypothetical protein